MCSLGALQRVHRKRFNRLRFLTFGYEGGTGEVSFPEMRLNTPAALRCILRPNTDSPVGAALRMVGMERM